MKYNKNRHLKLLQSSPKSENSMTNLSSKDFIEGLDCPMDDNFSDLESYSAMLTGHLHWENREQYFELIEKLLNGPINFLPLLQKHRSIINTAEMLEARLILLDPNPKSEGFENFIDDLFFLSQSTKFTEGELKKLIQQIFIQMKDRYP